jgi:hypothetical protein
MKKRILIGVAGLALVAAAAITTISTVNANASNSDLMTENIIALSNGESGSYDDVFQEAFKTAYNALYDALYNTVRDRCPGGTINCTDITGTIDVMGQSLSVTVYFHKAS